MNLSFEKQDLANSYAEFKLTDELKDLYLNKLRMPLRFAKTMLFANEAKITNDIIDYWVFFSSERQEDELFDDYKNRRKFQNALSKYRKYLYNYDNTQIIN